MAPSCIRDLRHRETAKWGGGAQVDDLPTSQFLHAMGCMSNSLQFLSTKERIDLVKLDKRSGTLMQVFDPDEINFARSFFGQNTIQYIPQNLLKNIFVSTDEIPKLNTHCPSDFVKFYRIHKEYPIYYSQHGYQQQIDKAKQWVGKSARSPVSRFHISDYCVLTVGLFSQHS